MTSNFSAIYDALRDDDSLALKSLLIEHPLSNKDTKQCLHLSLELNAFKCAKYLHLENESGLLEILSCALSDTSFDIKNKHELTPLITRYSEILLSLSDPSSSDFTDSFYLKVKAYSQNILNKILNRNYSEYSDIISLLVPSLEHTKVFMSFMGAELAKDNNLSDISRFLLMPADEGATYLDLLHEKEHAELISVMFNKFELNAKKSNADEHQVDYFLEVLCSRPLGDISQVKSVILDNYSRTITIIDFSFKLSKRKISKSLTKFIQYLLNIDKTYKLYRDDTINLFRLILGDINRLIYVQLPDYVQTELIYGIYNTKERHAVKIVSEIIKMAAFPQIMINYFKNRSSLTQESALCEHKLFCDSVSLSIKAIANHSRLKSTVAELVVTAMMMEQYTANPREQFETLRSYLDILGELPEISSDTSRLKAVLPTRSLRLVDYFLLISYSDKEISSFIVCEGSAEVILKVTSLSPFSLLPYAEDEGAKKYLMKVFKDA